MNGFIKKTLIFVVVMAMVAGVGLVGRKAYKKATERRLLTEASQYLERNDFTNASLCLRRVLQVNPASARASELTADLLEATGTPAALSWRIRAYQLQTNNLDYRFAWAKTALEMNDQRSAILALSGLEPKATNTATFHKLAGGLAWSLKDAADAEKQYQAALRLEPANQTTILNLATVQLVSTNEAVADAARLALEQIPTNSPVRPAAWRYLAADAATHKHFDKAVAFSDRVINSPAATYADKIAHLELLRDANSSSYNHWRTGLEEEARHSPDHAFALGQWMAVKDNPTNALRWLLTLPAAEQTNMPVPRIITDCEIATKDWKGLRSVIGKQDWGDLEYYRCALESLAARHLDDNFASRNAWQRTVLLAGHQLDRLTQLAEVTASWNWDVELDQTLQEVISEFPKEQWAVDALSKLLYAKGDSAGLADLVTRVYAANPTDNRLKNNLANISLLRKSDLQNAYRLAQDAYNSQPDNPFYLITYSYSLLVQKKPEEAAKIMTGLKTEYLKNPTIAAYYGVVQVGAGHKDVAREPLKTAESAHLLPEENELVRQAAAQL